MTAQDEALAGIEESHLLSALEWAAPIAFARTGNDYDEDAGHDQAVIGIHNFVYLRDLLDRATSNGRYALAPGATGEGRDVIGRGITAEALASMPAIAPGAIVRRDYQHSPGWAAGGYRVLLQSFKSGGIDRIKWGARSNAKEAVALQHFIGDATLFDDEDFGLESLPGIPDDADFEGLTLIAAHSYDPMTGRFELFIGQSKLPEYRGGSCWHWRVRLLSGDADRSIAGAPTLPSRPVDPESTEAAEIEVRLRRQGRGGVASSGDE